jgi:DNA-damage-inducible protein D
MGITVFFANLIRATQTEEELKKGKIYGRAKVNKAHYKVGKKVRRTSQELGGAMLEASQEERSIKSLVTKSDAQD